MDRSSVVVKVHTRDIVDILYGSFGGKLQCYMLNSTFILLIKFIMWYAGGLIRNHSLVDRKNEHILTTALLQ